MALYKPRTERTGLKINNYQAQVVKIDIGGAAFKNPASMHRRFRRSFAHVLKKKIILCHPQNNN